MTSAAQARSVRAVADRPRMACDANVNSGARFEIGYRDRETLGSASALAVTARTS